MSGRVRLTFTLIVLGVFLAGAVGAQKFAYPTKCKVVAEGNLKTSANIATPLLVDHDFRSENLAATFPITSSSSLTFNGLDDSFAELFRTGFGGGGCVTDISTAIAGQVVYTFTGDKMDMSAAINSVTIQSASITRQNVTGTGVAITASNSYDVPQSQQLIVEIPFSITGASGRLTVKPFSFSRTDTTSTTGSTVGAYQVFADNNSNCTVDTGDSSNIGSAGIVFPNSTFSEPAQSFTVSPGDYVLVLSYFTDVDLAAFSPDCNTSVSLSGHEVDGFNVGLNIQ